VALVRRPVPEHLKLMAPVADFERLSSSADWWHAMR
jgi:hypothetical protein